MPANRFRVGLLHEAVVVIPGKGPSLGLCFVQRESVAQAGVKMPVDIEDVRIHQRGVDMAFRDRQQEVLHAGFFDGFEFELRQLGLGPLQDFLVAGPGNDGHAQTNQVFNASRALGAAAVNDLGMGLVIVGAEGVRVRLAAIRSPWPFCSIPASLLNASATRTSTSTPINEANAATSSYSGPVSPSAPRK